MTDISGDRAVKDAHNKVAPNTPGLLQIVEEKAGNVLSGVQKTIHDAGSAIEERPYQALGTLGTLAVGTAAAVYFDRKNSAARIAKTLLKGEALDAKSLEVPALFGDAKKVAQPVRPHSAISKAVRGSDVLEPSETHLDFASEGEPTLPKPATKSDLLSQLSVERPASKPDFKELAAIVGDIDKTLREHTPVASISDLEKALIPESRAAEHLPPVRDQLGTISFGGRTEAELKTMADSTNKFDRMEAAMQPKTPKDSLLKLARDGEPEVKSVLTVNKDLPSEVVDILAQDASNSIKINAARAKNLRPETAANLAKDESLEVREAAYRNPNMPADKLATASKDEAYQIRDAVASNPNTPSGTLRQMAADTDSFDMHYSILKNSNTPADLKGVLQAEVDRVMAASDPMTSASELTELAKAPEATTKFQLIKNKNTPPEALRTLTSDENRNIRLAALDHQNVPPDVLAKESTNPDEMFRWAVANNKSTPPATLREMANDTDMSTRVIVQRNPSTPDDVRQALVERDGFKQDRKF